MKNIIVSGCARGIGEAVTDMLLKKGYCVTGLSRTDEDEVIKKFASDKFRYFKGDLSSSDHRKGLVEFALSEFRRIDGLVNVAGVAPKERRDLLDLTEESYDFVNSINTKGTFFLTQEVAKELIKNDISDGVRGHIVNISSLSSYATSVNRGEYCISKAGVTMITKLFADRLSEYLIPVNEICPGIIATDMTSKVKNKYDALIEGGLLPIKRWGEPSDIAKAVLAVIDGNLPYMTGQSVNIDGGFHLKRL